MMSAPITITSHDKTWTILPEQIASWLDFLAVYQNDVPIFVPYLSEGRMVAFLDSLAAEVKLEPVERRIQDRRWEAGGRSVGHRGDARPHGHRQGPERARPSPPNGRSR